MKKPDTIFVRNNGTEPFSSRFDGEDFTIAPGHAIEMLADCATLCLGFGDEDKTRCLRRLGWAFTGADLKPAEARLAKFSFHMKEQEALDFGKDKKARSAAPAGGGEPSALPAHKAGAAEEAPIGKLVNPLEKLAAANAAAAG